MLSLFKLTLSIIGLFSISLGSAFAADAINDKCPISGKAVKDSKRVELVAKFCCGKCIAKFKKDPKAYAAKVAKAADGKCAFSGKDAKKETKISIAVCCGKCKKKGDADPKALFAKLQKKKKKEES
jgi:hypothetical protein